MRTWLMQLWRLRNPMICCLQASGIIQPESKALRTRGADSVNLNLRARADEMFQLNQ